MSDEPCSSNSLRRSSRKSVKVTRYEDAQQKQENEIIEANGCRPEIMDWEGYNPLHNLDTNYKRREQSNKKKNAEMMKELIAQHAKRQKERLARKKKKAAEKKGKKGKTGKLATKKGTTKKGPSKPETSRQAKLRRGISKKESTPPTTSSDVAPRRGRGRKRSAPDPDPVPDTERESSPEMVEKKIVQFCCNLCPTRFGSQSTYYYHLTQHGLEGKKVTCKYCDYTATYEKNMAAHEELHEQNPDFEVTVEKKPKLITIVMVPKSSVSKSKAPPAKKKPLPIVVEEDEPEEEEEPEEEVEQEDEAEQEEGEEEESDDDSASEGPPFYFSSDEELDEEEEPTGPFPIPAHIFPPIKNQDNLDAYIHRATGFTRQFLEEHRWGANPTMRALEELRKKYPQPPVPTHDLTVFALNEKMGKIVKKEPFKQGPLMTRARLFNTNPIRSCKKCSFKCNTQTGYVEHVDCHGWEATYKCDKCDYMHDSEANVEHHKANDHKDLQSTSSA